MSELQLTPSPPANQQHSPLSASERTPEQSNRPFHRSSTSHKHLQPHAHGHHGGHVKARIGGRVHSHKNLTKIGLGINPSSHSQSIPMAPTSSSTPQRPSAIRSNSKSLASPTAGSPQARPSVVKRNASGFVVPRTNTHSVLKKNHSDRHLPRHGSSKNIAKAARAAAPPMRRTQSSKSVTSNKSHKSDKSSGEREKQTTVRFDLGDEDGAADDHEDNDNAEEGDEWTDSTSLSPSTTRDHTRQNSVILGNAMMTSPARQPSSLSQETLVPRSPDEKENTEPTNVRKSTLNHSVLTPDAITSRLLMRAPSAQQLTTVSATAVGSPSIAHMSDSHLSNEATGSSGGTSLVSRFLAGGNSHGATPELLDRTIASRSATKDAGSDSDGYSKSVDSHRRNKSTSNVAAMKSSSRNSTPTILPPSRTSQKLQLQRASTMVEPSRKIPILPSRPTAPLLLSSVNNSFGLGEGEGGAINVHYQGLYSQIDKDYAVVRRYRRPVEEAIARLDKQRESKDKGKGKAPLQPRSTAQTPGTQLKQQRLRPSASLDLRPSKSHGALQQQQQQPEIRAPQHLNSRRSRVAFEIPTAQQSAAEEAQAAAHGMRGVDPQMAEMVELCRRMWDLSSVSEPVAFG